MKKNEKTTEKILTERDKNTFSFTISSEFPFVYNDLGLLRTSPSPSLFHMSSKMVLSCSLDSHLKLDIVILVKSMKIDRESGSGRKDAGFGRERKKGEWGMKGEKRGKRSERRDMVGYEGGENDKRG
jgi:hypothetical protein